MRLVLEVGGHGVGGVPEAERALSALAAGDAPLLNLPSGTRVAPAPPQPVLVSLLLCPPPTRTQKT